MGAAGFGEEEEGTRPTGIEFFGAVPLGGAQPGHNPAQVIFRLGGPICSGAQVAYRLNTDWVDPSRRKSTCSSRDF